MLGNHNCDISNLTWRAHLSVWTKHFMAQNWELLNQQNIFDTLLKIQVCQTWHQHVTSFLLLFLSRRLWVRVGSKHGVIKSRGAGEAGKRPGGCGSLSSRRTERLPAVPPTGLQCRLPHDITAKPRPLPGGWHRLPGSSHGDHNQRYTREPQGMFRHWTLGLSGYQISQHDYRGRKN